MAVSTLICGGPFGGRPSNDRPTLWGVSQGPQIFGTSYSFCVYTYIYIYTCVYIHTNTKNISLSLAWPFGEAEVIYDAVAVSTLPFWSPEELLGFETLRVTIDDQGLLAVFLGLGYYSCTLGPKVGSC